MKGRKQSIEITLFSVLILSLISFSGGNLAHGLSCELSTLKDQFDGSDAVFVGKVISKEKTSNESMFYVTFNVTDTFKGIANKTVTILSSETIWNPPFEKGKEYVILAGNYNGSLFAGSECTYSGISTPEFLNQVELLKSKILSPHKQLVNGVLPEEIVCKEGLQLIFKSKDNSPACVTESTKTKLIERGWGNKTIAVQNSDFVISYSVTKGELISAMANLDMQLLVLDIQMVDDSNMTVKLPRGLIDSINNGKDEVFTVLVEGKKVEHKEQNTQNHRILNFPLLSSETGSVIVEIIPYCPSWRCDV